MTPLRGAQLSLTIMVLMLLCGGEKSHPATAFASYMLLGSFAGEYIVDLYHSGKR